jgi:predicted histidine transporter YuiF (NhaC family)
VNNLLPLLPANKAVSAFLILLVGLVITLGIGSSFSTIPIVSTIFVPLCVKLNFSVSEIIITMTAAAALGDAGAPVSETALGTTAGLNVDGQHDHIRDTCVPTFLHYNTALFLCALLAIVFGWV